MTLPALPDAEETTLTLLDTPGHVDFSAEAERALQVLDYAVLVISGTDGVQAHTETLWKLLARYRVPTFIFVNKMDLPGADAAVRLRELRGRFGDGCVDFTTAPDPEALALCSEPLMEEVLARGQPQHDTLLMAIARRQVFPCFFGAALTAGRPGWPAAWSAIPDADAPRLGRIRRTGVQSQRGCRHPPELAESNRRRAARKRYAAGRRKGRHPSPVQRRQVPAGQRVPARHRGGRDRPRQHPPRPRPGGRGRRQRPLLEPVLNYRVDCPDADPHTVLRALQTLEDEDPQLHVAWRAIWPRCMCS